MAKSAEFFSERTSSAGVVRYAFIHCSEDSGTLYARVKIFYVRPIYPNFLITPFGSANYLTVGDWHLFSGFASPARIDVDLG